VDYWYDVVNTFTPPYAHNHVGDTITWRVAYYIHDTIGGYSANSETEAVWFYIPGYMGILESEYNPVSNAPINFSGLTEYLYTDDNGIVNGHEYTFAVPDGLQDGDSIVFEMVFTTYLAECEEHEFYASAFFAFEIVCDDDTCSANIKIAESYPTLSVESFSAATVYPSSVRGNITDNNEWYGFLDFTVLSPFEAGDNIYVDFYLDDNHNNRLDLLEDVLVATQVFPTGNWNSTFYLEITDAHAIPFPENTQLFAYVYNDSVLCERQIIPIATLYGIHEVCEGDTLLLKAPSGKFTKFARAIPYY